MRALKERMLLLERDTYLDDVSRSLSLGARAHTLSLFLSRASSHASSRSLIPPMKRTHVGMTLSHMRSTAISVSLVLSRTLSQADCHTHSPTLSRTLYRQQDGNVSWAHHNRAEVFDGRRETHLPSESPAMPNRRGYILSFLRTLSTSP
jgi:hypothetical protein